MKQLNSMRIFLLLILVSISATSGCDSQDSKYKPDRVPSETGKSDDSPPTSVAPPTPQAPVKPGDPTQAPLGPRK